MVGAMVHGDNIYDGCTIESQLAQVKDLLGRLPETAKIERGSIWRKGILGVNIKLPGFERGKTAYQIVKEKKRFHRRASIERIIRHLLQGHMIRRNYFRNVEANMISTLLIDAAFNMMKMLRKILDSVICVINELIKKLVRNYLILINY